MSDPLMTFRISRPLPLPSLAPFMRPGRSRICIFAPLCSIKPGMQVSVVKAKAPASDSAPVSCEMRLDLPTDGNPTSATLASPDFFTSNPGALPPDLACAFSFFSLSAAIFALSFPMCPWVALLYFVLEISSSRDLICSSMVAMATLRG